MIEGWEVPHALMLDAECKGEAMHTAMKLHVAVEVGQNTT